jgi:site-specific DNA-methyltransferase (adenine-specific)
MEKSVQKIACQECLAGMNDLQERSVDCIITSPPYNIGIAYSEHQDTRADYLPWLRSIFTACDRVLKNNGHFFLQMGGTSKRPLIPQEVLTEAIAAGFTLQNEIIWVKNISIGEKSFGQFKPINSPRFLNHTHEFIFHLTKKGDAPVNRLAVGVPFEYASNIARFSQKSTRCRGNVWFIPYDTIQTKSERFGHPATFPIALPEMCIKLSGIPRGAQVLDPFAGIGTTLVAARNLGMNGLGFEISKDYVESARRRLQN